MNNPSLVALALEAQACSQKDLATRLGVSPAQISKWKKGEHMSREMQTKLREIVGIGDRLPEFVLMAGTLTDAIKWERLLRHLADNAVFASETGYHTYPLEDEEAADLLCWNTLHVLTEMGVQIPKPFPPALDFDYDAEEDEARERCETMGDDPFVALISAIYKSYTDVYGFYLAYVDELINELDLSDPPVCDVEPNLLALAAAKLEETPAIASKFHDFRRKTHRDYREALKLIKEKAFQAGLPLRAELMNMVFEGHDALGHEAEAESLGFTDTRLHPDIYMNELLVGMRIVHQVLPAILKKLGIEEEFRLDEAALGLGRARPSD